MKYYLYTLFLILLFTLSRCIDPFNPSAKNTNVHYLVIDGFINSSDGSGTIKLSRTIPLNSSDSVPLVSNATLSIEDEEGDTFGFSEVETGVYELINADFSINKKYRLKIKLNTDEEYLSDFVEPMETPKIDSISWKQLNNKVEIYANTHDSARETGYYRWRYVETWHYTSAFHSYLKFSGNAVVFRDQDDDIFNCYQTFASNDVLIHSTSNLHNNIIKEFPLTTFPITSPKIQKRYSIEVQQYSITKEAYDYWEQLKKTTENLGSLFDPQPTQVRGNFYNVSNPDEPVIGFFSIGSTDKKRIFIHVTQLEFPIGTGPTFEFYADCRQDTIPLSLIADYAESGTLLTSPAYQGIFIVGYLTSSPTCVDCRFAGGTNIKPDFWP